MRLPACLFAVAALVVLAANPIPAGAQKKGDPKELPPQNELATKFGDSSGDFKGKTLTFEAEYAEKGVALLRNRVLTDKVPFWVYSPTRKAKVAISVDMKALPTTEIPNIRSGESVIVTFICGDGSVNKGNKVVAFRRPE